MPDEKRKEFNLEEWFKSRTFHNSQFADIKKLVRLKKRKNLTISVGIPTLNEVKTVGTIIDCFKTELMGKYPLVDEIAVIDSGSTDNTVEMAKSKGAKVFLAERCLKEEGLYYGKGENLWKSLHVLTGNIIVWIDADIRNIHPKFVYGLVGPLITNDKIGFVKGFYRRPLKFGKKMRPTGGGRVTEIAVRPLFNLFFPELAGLIQPLSGEMAGRREILEQIPFFIGYGVETGMLIDISNQFGVETIAQVDLEKRVHRNRSTVALGKMSFGIMQAFFKRAEQLGKIELKAPIGNILKRAKGHEGDYELYEKEIKEEERPPIKTVDKYGKKHAKSMFDYLNVRLSRLLKK